MIEYPSIIASSKAPRKHCIAFDKLDGSNIRVKFSHKAGFTLFGSRRQLFDQSHQMLGPAIPFFQERCAEPIERILKDKYKDVKDIIVFGEWGGEKSFAGTHDPEDPTREFVLFDVLLCRKNINSFVPPNEFVKTFSNAVKIPRVIYEGNLNEKFIKDVRANLFETKEGVICKGTETVGHAFGKVWMCKIKTQMYLDSLKQKYGNDWQQYGE
jgi:hypothetical protein